MARTCNKCLKKKSDRDMVKKRRKDGSIYIYPKCLKCSLDQIADWQSKETRVGRRWRHLKRRYGITRSQYFRMLKKQGGVCAICKNPPDHKSIKGRVLAVDHNHLTDKNRALLCFQCNVFVAWVENAALHEKILAYLRKYQ